MSRLTEKYAATNRERLKKQKIALGDIVRVLEGRFEGEIGLVKGIYAFEDFDDLYYDVDMGQEVPPAYRSRTSNSVIGGLSASDFEVICNHVTDSEPKPQPKMYVEVDKVSEETANRLAERLAKIRPIEGVEGVIPTPAWQSYRMELAKAVAIAYAEKGRYEPSEIGAKAVEVADGVVSKLKNSKI